MLEESKEPINQETPQSLGGFQRAKVLSSETRRDIASKAATARWEKQKILLDPNRMPSAEYQGELLIGDISVKCYVLDDGRRLIHKRGMAKALGVKHEAGNAFSRTMATKGIGAALGEKLKEKINNPILFKTEGLEPAHGYEAIELVEICNAIMQARADKQLAPSQKFLADQAEIIVRACAKVGITALVDEATGFIADKRKDEYRKLFKEFIREECRKWEKEFPDQFFDMLYRLYGLKRRDPKSVKHPRFFSLLIRKYIYYPLANSNGAILAELDEKNPVVYFGGGRKHRLHQFLTDEIGLPAFKAHLWQVIGIGNSVTDRASFEKAFNRAFTPPSRQTDFLADLF